MRHEESFEEALERINGVLEAMEDNNVSIKIDDITEEIIYSVITDDGSLFTFDEYGELISASEEE